MMIQIKAKHNNLSPSTIINRIIVFGYQRCKKCPPKKTLLRRESVHSQENQPFIYLFLYKKTRLNLGLEFILFIFKNLTKPRGEALDLFHKRNYKEN